MGTPLRLTKKSEMGNLLEYIKTLEPDEEFATLMDDVVRNRGKVTLTASEL